MPIVIGQRAPIKSVTLPASGAETTTRNVMGRKTTLACTGE
jgi:hypothetical protein